MKHNPSILVFAGWLFFSVFPKSYPVITEPTSLHPNEEAVSDSIKITILYDNYVFAQGTQANWGFSCLIENTAETILFDTGTDPDILIKNVNELDKDLSQVDIIVISHNHRDHTGGLFEALRLSENAKVYLPHSTSKSYMNEVKKTGAVLFSEKESTSIAVDCYLTGELGSDIKEQSLILNTKNGLVVITGCSHPGIVNIVRSAHSILGKEVYMVFGGFHLMRHASDEIHDIITSLKDSGVKYCGATHCSGDEAIQLFQQAFGQNFLQMGTGRVIKIPS